MAGLQVVHHAPYKFLVIKHCIKARLISFISQQLTTTGDNHTIHLQAAD